MSAALQRMADQFEALSPREKRLASAVGALVALFVVFSIVRTALGTLASMDAQINRLQQTILNVENQIRHRESIEAQYARVASQHSSAWSEAEILDRLRAEIYRLAQKEPPALNADGVPEEVTSKSGELVTIPTIQQGNLSEGEQGYREYMLSFSVPPAPLENMLNFVDRLQNSPQSLRVDAIELVRDPLGDEVSANLTITRTIVAGVAEGGKVNGEKEAAPAGEAPKGQRLVAADWKCDDCTVTPVPAEGEASELVITATAPGAVAYLERAMPPAQYEMVIDAAASGPATLGIADDGQPLEGAQEMAGSGRPARYTVQFMPRSSERVPLRVPVFTLAEKDATVRLSRLAVRTVTP